MSSTILVLGSSPNALVAAAYLRLEGHSVTVLEPTFHLGGPIESSPFATGHRGEQGLLSLSLDPTVLRELDLKVECQSTSHKVALGADGAWVRLRHDGLDGALSESDRQRWPAFVELLDQTARLWHASSLRHPDTVSQAGLVEPWRALGERPSRETLRLPWMSLKDLLEEWFESDVLKGALAFIGLKGSLQGPFASGTAFGLIQQWATRCALERHTTDHGVHPMVEQIVEQLRARGVEFRTGCPLAGIALDNDKAVGVRLQDGEVLPADQIFSDYDAAHTFRQLVSPRDVETSFLTALHKMRFNGCVARLNLAVHQFPSVEGLTAEDWKAGVILTPGLWGTEKAYDPTKYGKSSTGLLAEVVLTHDHPAVLSVWGQYFPYKCSPGNLKASLLERFPELRVEHEQELLPADLEKRYSLTQGHFFGGELSINQALFLRPNGEYKAGQFPIENLHLCGSTIHPGGYSGLAGRLAAYDCIKQIAFV